jgi:hypothetical protein
MRGCGQDMVNVRSIWSRYLRERHELVFRELQLCVSFQEG